MRACARRCARTNMRVTCTYMYVVHACNTRGTRVRLLSCRWAVLYKIVYVYTRKRAKRTEQNGTERAERDEINHPFIHCKTEQNGNGKYFLMCTVRNSCAVVNQLSISFIASLIPRPFSHTVHARKIAKRGKGLIRNIM